MNPATKAAVIEALEQLVVAVQNATPDEGCEQSIACAKAMGEAAIQSLRSVPDAQPVAWAIFTDKGYARMWTTFQPHVQKLADAEGLTVTPLYADPAALRSEPEPTTEQSTVVERDTERMNWLDNNIFHIEPDEWTRTHHPHLNTWRIFAPKGVQGSARNIIDAARASLPPAPEPVAGWQWVPVAERLPKPFEEVLIYPRPTDYCCEGQVDCKGQWTYSEYERDGVVTYKIQPTHWAALPPAPTKGTE